MTSQQLAKVLFGVAGVYLVASRLVEFSVIISVFWQTHSTSVTREVLAYGLTGTITAGFLGGGLAYWREALARRLFPEETPPLSQTLNLDRVGFVILGAYFLVRGASEIARFGAMSLEEYMTGVVSSLVKALVELGLGVWLLLGNKVIAKIISSFGSTGPGKEQL